MRLAWPQAQDPKKGTPWIREVYDVKPNQIPPRPAGPPPCLKGWDTRSQKPQPRGRKPTKLGDCSSKGWLHRHSATCRHQGISAPPPHAPAAVQTRRSFRYKAPPRVNISKHTLATVACTALAPGARGSGRFGMKTSAWPPPGKYETRRGRLLRQHVENKKKQKHGYWQKHVNALLTLTLGTGSPRFCSSR